MLAVIMPLRITSPLKTECLTFDCSGNPIRITIRWSAICEPASSGIGMQDDGEFGQTTLCVRDPRSSQDSKRMCETHSMNSFGLSRKSGFYNELSFLVFPRRWSLLMHTRQMQSQCAGGTDHWYRSWED